jgi:hypothetical protein
MAPDDVTSIPRAPGPPTRILNSPTSAFDCWRSRPFRRFECVADFDAAKGYSVGEMGHVTIVVDRASRELVGAAMACPDASAAIHECVLAIRARVPMEILAETIHAFPSTSRILNGLFDEAARMLRADGVERVV